MDIDEEMKEKHQQSLEIWNEMDSLVERELLDIREDIGGIKRKLEIAFPDEEGMISVKINGITNILKHLNALFDKHRNHKMTTF